MIKKYIKLGFWIVVAIVIIGIIFILISNKNSQDSLTCNYPYIKVGPSCCLDQNQNNLCDNDEQIQEAKKKVWELNDFSVYGGTGEEFAGCSQGIGVYNNFNNLGVTSSKNIDLSRFHQYLGEPAGYGETYENYQTAVLIAYTSYNLNFYDEYEGVTCEIEEYYDGKFNEVNTVSFKHNFGLPEDKYGFIWQLFYSKNDKPSEAKYIISFKGDKSGREVKKTFRFNINYVDKVTVIKC